MLTRAIVRPPGTNFGDGLSTVDLGPPDYEHALAQHAAYCAALQRCGLTIIGLEADPAYPDSCFVEDTAILASGSAILTRPGEPSRRGEVDSVRKVLTDYFSSLSEIRSPGILDGGDVCEAGNHYFIGISDRTNEAGAQQLARLIGLRGSTSSFIDIRPVDDLLHLKSAIAYLGDNRLATTNALADRKELAGYNLTRMDSNEEYAANCVRINGHVLVANGYPKFERRLRDLGYQTISLDMSEFQKMDGGLSCLSLRF